MKRSLIMLNAVAAVVIIFWGGHRYAAPIFVESIYGASYKELMFQCDHVMREHFIAKQLVLEAPNEETIRNLESSEIGFWKAMSRELMVYQGFEAPDAVDLALEFLETFHEKLQEHQQNKGD